MPLCLTAVVPLRLKTFPVSVTMPTCPHNELADHIVLQNERADESIERNKNSSV